MWGAGTSWSVDVAGSCELTLVSAGVAPVSPRLQGHIPKGNGTVYRQVQELHSSLSAVECKEAEAGPQIRVKAELIGT